MEAMEAMEEGAPAGSGAGYVLDERSVVRGIPLDGDQFHRNMERLEESGEASPDEVAMIRWLYGWAKTKGLSVGAAAKAVGVDTSTVSRLFAGQYGAKYAGVCQRIARWKRLAEARAGRKEIGFVETSVWRKVDAVCSAALNDQLPAFIYGASQIGKTTCLLEFQRRNNHGQTKYVRMPAAPNFAYFVQSLARACFVSPGERRVDELRDRICEAIDSTNLVIVDEFHQALATATEQRAAQIMEFIREVYDRTRCGLVLSATKVGEEMFENGPKAKVYDQLRRRGMVKLTLPDTPPASDIRKIAAAFGLPPPEGAVLEAVKSMLRASGTGMYIKYLQAASTLAGRRGQKLDWEAFASVWDGMRSLAADE